MYFKKFNVGDFVSYKGVRFAKELYGKRGTVVARVQNQNAGVVVEFGSDDSYIVDENRHLAKFQGKPEVEDKKEPEVQKKRGRRVVSQVVATPDEE